EQDPKGDEVLLTVIHRRLADRGTMLLVGSGWHLLLDVLAARAAGKKPEAFWDGWSRLRKEYDRRLPA
ncbi:MAG: ATPase, partial [Parvibaculaceae bacterium]